MRRKDREVTGLDEMEAMLRAETVCRVCFHGDPYPYIVPLNFGFTRDGDRFTLYFHCAKVGEKLDRMRADPNVAFEVDGAHQLVDGPNACDYSFGFQSVIGTGTLSEVAGEERRAGLIALMRQVAPDRDFDCMDVDLERGVNVLRLDVAQMTGKRHVLKG